MSINVLCGVMLAGISAIAPARDDEAAARAIETFKEAVGKAKAAEEKALAIQALGRCPVKDPAMVPLLSKYLRPRGGDLNMILPGYAAEALATFRNDRRASVALLKTAWALKNQPALFRQAVIAVGDVGHVSAVPFFEGFLTGDDKALALLALDGVRNLPADKALDLLFKLQKGGQWNGDVEKAALAVVHELSGENWPTWQEMNIWWKKRGEKFKESLKAGKEAPAAGVAPTAAAAPESPGLKPILLLRLPFGEGNGDETTVRGSIGMMFKGARLSKTRPGWTTASAPGSKNALDWGTEPGPFATDLKGKIPHLRNLKSFTVTGWVNLKAKETGEGGNAIVTWLRRENDGVEIVLNAGGVLQVGVNQPAAESPAKTAEGKVPVLTDPSDAKVVDANWRFFAVTYDSTLEAGHVKIYLGTKRTDAQLSVTHDYARGPVGPKIHPAVTVGHIAHPLRLRHPDRMFRGMIDEVRVYGSTWDGSGALSAAEVVEAQDLPERP